MTHEVVPGVSLAFDDVGVGFADPVLVDVRVVAWNSTGPGAVAALQDVFGLDVETAQQLIACVPATVKRGVVASEARNFMQALEGVGAQVVLVRPGGPITMDQGRPRVPVALSTPPPLPPPSQMQRASSAVPLPPANRAYALPPQTFSGHSLGGH